MKIFILLLGIIALASNSVECCSTSGGTSGGGGGGGGGVSSSDFGGGGGVSSSDVGGGGGVSSSDVESDKSFEELTACKILKHPGIKLVTNNGIFPRSNGLKYHEHDGADAYSNIEDTCDGYQARRSTYPCPPGKETQALGGYVSLKASVLKYILKVANEGEYNRATKLQINVIAGECHSSLESWHMDGRSVDIQIRREEPKSYYQSWMKICKDLGGEQNLGPPRTDHTRHTHCGFPS